MLRSRHDRPYCLWFLLYKLILIVDFTSQHKFWKNKKVHTCMNISTSVSTTSLSCDTLWDGTDYIPCIVVFCQNWKRKVINHIYLKKQNKTKTHPFNSGFVSSPPFPSVFVCLFVYLYFICVFFGCLTLFFLNGWGSIPLKFSNIKTYIFHGILVILQKMLYGIFKTIIWLYQT